jgi:hypothetical protein
LYIFSFQVTREAVLLDLHHGGAPSNASWIHLGSRAKGLQQQVSHWQQWFFVLEVQPEAPNGALYVSAITQPQDFKVRESPSYVSL